MAIAQMKRVPGTLIVAGIGTEASFEALLKMLGGLPKRVIVAEPAETRGGKSVQALEGLDGVTIVDGVLADGSGEVELVQYNLPGLRGLTAPTPALKALFPGLKERNRVTVRKVALASVVGNAGELPNPVRLRIDLPGAEPMALKALEDGGILAKADLVSMRCGAEAMFDGGWPRAQLQDWLQARYIRLEHAADDDPDWPDLRLKADATGRKLATLEAENAKLKAICDQATAARERAMADLGLAIRMQGLLQTDLDDLRERYRQSETARSQQEDLLRKLTPRLQEAAQQLRQLQLVEAADAELLAPKATRARPRATPARKRTSRKKSADAQ